MSLSVDPIPYAEFILRHLMQRPFPEAVEMAVAETEEAIEGDRWFWADDNAKVLEFFALPALWSRYPEQSIEIFKFIEKLCFGPFILRRIGHARLDEVSNDGAGVARFIHTFMHISCDLMQGIVTIGMRFHDGRTAKNLIFSKNWIEFSYENERYQISVDASITTFSIRREGTLIFLEHESDLRVKREGLDRQVGTIKYMYVIDSQSMFVDVKVNLGLAPNVEISDVVMTISHHDLSHGDNWVDYSAIQLVTADGVARINAEELGTKDFFQPKVRYWSLVQGGWMRGFALAAHSITENPERFFKFRTEVTTSEKWHHVAACYKFEGSYSNTNLTIGERKILTAGGFYDRPLDYENMFNHYAQAPKTNPIDFSISYDYGAEINAFARTFRVLHAMPDSDRTRGVVLSSRELFDKYYKFYADLLMGAHKDDRSAIFSRPLAFVAFGLIDMYLVTRDEHYRSELRKVVDILLSFERPFVGEDGKPESAFLMGLVQSASPYVDCHSAVLLALVRSLPVLEDPALITKIDQGLDAYRVETMGIPLGDMRKQDLLCVGRPPEGQAPVAHAYWNFTAGITLRLFKLLRQSRHQATQEIYQRHKDRIAIQEALLNLQIQRSQKPRDGAIEVKTGWLSTEGNSETQPWVALGLVTDSGDLPPNHQFENLDSRTVDRDDVIAAYRLILGREPESEAVIRGHMKNQSLQSLRETFLNSEEFKRVIPQPSRHNGLPMTVMPLEIEVDTDPATLAKMAEKTGEYWNAIGRNAPHWSVVTAKEFLPENIADNKEAFFQSSAVDQEIILSGLARHGLDPVDFKSCVEFGCGVGRLTFRLAALFSRVTGIDISAPHLALAKEYCGRLGLSNIQFFQANAQALMPATGFDFWFSRIVLQHNPPPVSMEILRRVFRELPRGGVAMFQVPVHHVGYSFWANEYLNSTLGKNMEMHCIPQRVILDEAYALGMQLLEVREDTWVVSDGPEWLSNNFIFRKN